MKIRAWVGLFAVAIMVTACGSGGSTNGAASLEGEWRLLTMNDAPLLPDSTITLTFEGEKLSGYSGCNSYGGPYTQTGSNLRVGMVAMTLMACLDDDVMQQEQTYAEVLSNVAKFRLGDNRLELLDKSGAARLTYARQETFTGQPAALVGTEWRLLTLDGSALDETLSFTLTFTEDGYSGLAGCRHFEGNYQAGDGDIQFPSITMLEEDCPGAADAYYALEGRFTDALTWARHWRIVDDQLEIRTLQGESLIFAPAAPLP